VFSTAFSLVYHLIVVVKFFALETFEANLSLMAIVSTTSRMLYLILFTYMVIQWISLLRYFVAVKIQRRADLCLDLSLGNQLTILWAVTLSIALTYHHYSLVISGLLEFYLGTETDFYRYFTFCLYPLDVIIIFLTSGSLLYLFYFQGKIQMVRADEESNNRISICSEQENRELFESIMTSNVETYNEESS
jgi:hypothetical protein